MDSRLLECFLRVSELGSINKAAADLHMSQPALSRHIALLEHDINTQLFTRSQGGVRLTEAGKLLADRARPLLRQFAIIKEQVGQRAAGQLSIGIPSSWHGVFTADYAATLLDESPEVALRIYEGVSHTLREHLLSGLLDLCIAPLGKMPGGGYTQTPLAREPLVVVGDANCGLHPGKPVSVSFLHAKKLILPGRPNVLSKQVENALADKKLQFRLAVESDTLPLCLELAARGAGLTVVPACALHHRGQNLGMSWAPLRAMHLDWALLENDARSHSSAVREGRRFLVQTLDQAIQSNTWFGASRLPGN